LTGVDCDYKQFHFCERPLLYNAGSTTTITGTIVKNPDYIPFKNSLTSWPGYLDTSKERSWWEALKVHACKEEAKCYTSKDLENGHIKIENTKGVTITLPKVNSK
jgi:hypothetical protein